MAKKTLPVYKTPTAERKIIEIIKWSAKKWGKKTARDYVAHIEKVINSVASGNLPCQKNPEFSSRFSYRTAGRHYVFFEHKNDKLIVVTIFHASMQIKDRLREENHFVSREIKNFE